MSDSFDASSVWQRVLEGHQEAFEQVVAKYQSAVSAVAYSLTGNLSQSQDIAQETFLEGWRLRQQLRQPEKLGAWLCGIARNLAKQQLKKNRRSHSMPNGLAYVPDHSETPLMQSITDEELEMVRKALDALPDSYREAMVLYYRQEESIADVADCLGLTQDAVRQRLSRGRTFLRDRLMHLIQETLVQTRPTRAFTRSVMAAIGSLSMASHLTQAAGPATLTAATGLAAGKAFGAGLSTGLMSLGGLLGLMGTWVGQWFHEQLVGTERERTLTKAYGRKVLFLVIVFLVSLVGLSFLLRIHFPYGMLLYTAGIAITFVLYQWQLMKAFRIKENQVKQLRESGQLGTENSTWLRQFLQLDSQSPYRWQGRVFRSRWECQGLPWIDIQFADPGVRSDRPRRTAVGWIAIGDYAEGRLFAMGERAFGFIAIGRIAKGFIAFGGIAIGGIAIGGIAIGGICIGGLALGVIGLGGLAVSGLAVGGISVGVYLAHGSLALSCYEAIGSIAISLHTASGNGSYGLVESHGYEHAQGSHQWIRVVKSYRLLFALGVVIFSLLISIFTLPLAYYLGPRKLDSIGEKASE